MKADEKTQEIGFHIQLPDGQPFGWPELRDFVDSLTKAVATHPEQIRPGDILPTQVRVGSAIPLFSGPPALGVTFERLAAGPDQTWTADMLRSSMDFYAWATRAKLTMWKDGAEVGPEIEAPADNPLNWVSRELICERGIVMSAGGSDGNVSIRLENGTLVRSCPGREMAKELAKHLYMRIEFDADARLGMIDKAIKEIDILSFEVLDRRPDARAAIAALREDRRAWKPVDTAAFLADRHDEDS